APRRRRAVRADAARRREPRADRPRFRPRRAQVRDGGRRDRGRDPRAAGGGRGGAARSARRARGESAGRPVTHPVADGEWHRLYPAPPFRRGGIVVIAIIGYLFVQFRDLFIGVFIGSVAGRGPSEDPFTRWLLEHAVLALVLVFAGLVLVIGFGWLS